MSPLPDARRDPVLLSVGWGALWALALGAWVVAPLTIEAHRLRPIGPLQWSLVAAALSLAFAVIGGVIGLLGGLLVSAAERVIAGRFLDRSWAYAFILGPIVATGYLLQGTLIHWGSFRSLHAWTRYRWHAALFAVACAATLVLAAILYRRLLGSSRRPAASTLAWGLTAAAVAGWVAMAVQSPVVASTAPSGRLVRVAGAPEHTPPVLFIGLDGATWRALEPAMANGSAPTLRRLVERGMHGTVEALWAPHWSGAAWAAIVTGLPRETTGVYEDLAAEAPGLPLFQVPIDSTPLLNPMYVVRAMYRVNGLVQFHPPPRRLLHGTPIWQMLHDAGIETAVVRWRFTFPPEEQAGIVVSDFVGNDQWEGMGVRRPAAGTAVSPPELADLLLAPFRSGTPSDPTLFTRLLPGPRPSNPPDAIGDPIEELELASDIDNRTFEVSEAILRLKPRLPFLAVYIGGLDSVEHAFWQYRFPEDFPANPPAAEDIQRLGPVLDRYVQYFDERLGRLLALYETEPNVVIVSDHGQGPTTTSSKWRGWHTKEGVFVAAGPSVVQRPDRIVVSYYDILPTLADLKGFHQPEALRGHSVLPSVPIAPVLGE